jgi:hypothetical protein
MAVKRATVTLSMEQLLLRGWPGELLPGDLEEACAAAQWAVVDERLPEDARARILSVWIEGIYQPAWDGRRS